MPGTATARLSILSGPSLGAPFPAVRAEFPAPRVPGLSAAELTEALREFLSPELFRAIPRPLADGSFATLVGALACALQDPGAAGDLPFRALGTPDGKAAVYVAFHDAGLASQALAAALDLALALHRRRAGQPVDGGSLDQRIRDVVTAAGQRQPDALTRALVRAARARGIPVYPAVPGKRLWLYGQGANGTIGFEAATHRDGMTGSRLAKDKLASNQFVRSLGLPGVEHRVARDAASARAAARQLGYPVVVKPVDGAKGAGVTVGVADDRALEAAFAAAAAASPGRVLVERLVPGDDHRLVVLGGRLAWAVRRSPAQVAGDGTHTVAQLVAAENARRRALHAELDAAPLPLDDVASAVLASQGLAPDAVPGAGRVVMLSRAANKARGGTITDCTADVHPDNRDMAEAIARAFHLDAAGIDFMTTDIGRSWQSGDGGVIEVNSTPGFSSDARAELIIRTRFPDGVTGRIPSVVIVGGTPADAEAVAGALAGRGHHVGLTSSGGTRLGDQRRCAATAALPERVLALVLDPACTALVIAVSADELREHGFPLDRCDLALVTGAGDVSPALLGLVRDCAATVMADLPAGRVAAAAGAALDALP